MADDGWIPVALLRLVVRHLIATVAIGVAIGAADRVFILFVPKMADTAETIEAFMLYGLLSVIGIKLIWEFWRRNGFNNALVTA
jgi:hypothetical protein